MRIRFRIGNPSTVSPTISWFYRTAICHARPLSPPRPSQQCRAHKKSKLDRSAQSNPPSPCCLFSFHFLPIFGTEMSVNEFEQNRPSREGLLMREAQLIEPRPISLSPNLLSAAKAAVRSEHSPPNVYCRFPEPIGDCATVGHVLFSSLLQTFRSPRGRRETSRPKKPSLRLSHWRVRWIRVTGGSRHSKSARL